jgi:hypothetical protein
VPARDIAVCYFVFPVERNQFVESPVYYRRNIDIQSDYYSISVVPHNQQNGSKQGTQVSIAYILSVNTYHTGILCKYRYIVYVQRSGNNSCVFDNIHQRHALRIVAYHHSQAYLFAHGWFFDARECYIFVFHRRRYRNADIDQYGNPD